MKQEIAFTKKKPVSEAVKDLISQLNQPTKECKTVFFFASVAYDFVSLSKEIKTFFPECEVIGVSTSGEISPSGFSKESIVLTTLSSKDIKVKGVLIKDANKYPIIYKKEIEEAARACDIQIGSPNSHRDAFALTFINGLCNAEEAILSLFYAVVKNDDFQIAGGSAGDDLQFKVTYVSYNGEVTSNGGVILFIKTRLRFMIYKENIYKATGAKLTLTEADIEHRKIVKINRQTPTDAYASALGIPVNQVNEAMLEHPLGRIFGNNMFISSLASLNTDKTINMYSRVLPNTTVDVLEPDNADTIFEETCQIVKNQIPKIGFLLLINCILRTISFENRNMCNKMITTYHRNFTTYCGFSSYGEQINKVNSNQTLVVIAIEEN